MKTTPSVCFEALFSQIWFLSIFWDQGLLLSSCMLGATKGGNSGARFWRKIFISHWKVPPPLWTPLCFSQPYTRLCVYQSAQAAENGSPPRPARWEELHFQELQLRSASDGVAGGTGKLCEMEVAHHYWVSNGFQEGCPCGKWITKVVRRSKKRIRAKQGWLQHYCLTDHRPKPPILLSPLAVIILTKTWELWSMWNAGVRPLPCLCIAGQVHCCPAFLRFPPASTCVFPEYLCYKRSKKPMSFLSHLLPIPYVWPPWGKAGCERLCGSLGAIQGRSTTHQSGGSRSLIDCSLDNNRISGVTTPAPSINKQVSQQILAFAFLSASSVQCHFSPIHLRRPIMKCQSKHSTTWRRAENQHLPEPCSSAAYHYTCAE